MAIVEARGVSKSYRKGVVLRDVDVALEEGVTYGLVGPNGSGKSVLLRLLCGIIPPTTGEVRIDPGFLSPDGAYPEKFGVIIDRPGFIPNRTGVENLRFLASFRRVIGEEEITDALRRVGLDPKNRERVSRYSLGMRQRLALAQALMEDQTVLLLDETFNALDTDGVEMVRAEIRAAQKSGRTIVFTSHDQREIDTLSDIQLRIDGQTVITSE